LPIVAIFTKIEIVSRFFDADLSTKLLTAFPCHFLLTISLLLLTGLNGMAQVDSLSAVADTLPLIPPKPGEQKEALKSKVDYQSADSIRFDLRQSRAYLYRNVDITYEDINIKADFVVINFNTNEVYATGLTDSTGKITGRPVFTQGSKSFSADTMTYNFETKKGIIRDVITQDGEGYLHGRKVKKLANDEINIATGAYTTCNLEHPHFSFKFSKSKVIPDNKVITGPAYMVVEDVPTPLVIPFGLFPNKKGQRSGIVIPAFGESASRGFYFENGGYYWAINDYMDFKLTGDIYTKGSWALQPLFRYRKRYRFDGTFNYNYTINILDDPGSPNYQKNRDFSIRWVHNQDPKARPNSRFSANVNIVSNKYNKFNPAFTNAYLSNTFQSGINYSTSWAGKYFLNTSLNHSQNTITKVVDLTLPQISFTVNRFYPLRKKTTTGRLKWYENISFDYKSNAENRVSTTDSLLFKEDITRKFNNGIKHNMNLSSGAIKILKQVILTNSFAYTERWYSRAITKDWSSGMLVQGDDTTYGYIKQDTLRGFHAARDFSFTSSLSTTLYGMFSFKAGPVKAIRHVMKPSLSFTYRPDFGTGEWGYYRHYQDATGKVQKYSMFEGSIYGGPPDGKSGIIGFNLGNNLEMKVRSMKDTVTGMKKVVLIENFSLSTGYNLARDSLNLDRIRLTGYTTLFKNIRVNYGSSYDPYILDSTGTRNLNRFEWDVNRRPFRIEKYNWRIGLSWSLSSTKTKQPKSSGRATEEELSDVNRHPENYVDWTVPWNLNISYDLNYTNTYDYKNLVRSAEKALIQTLTFNGDVNLTPKWKIGFRSGYDFEDHEFSYTSIDVYRDLHCWEMSFNWIPLGFRQSWSFTINIKSSLLQDLKLDKKKDFRDY